MARVRSQADKARTQEQRSDATRARLLDAAILCLNERGYAKTSTNDVVARAGLSRGAMLHHFPSRLELFLTAAEHASEQRIAEFRAAVSGIADEADRVREALVAVWQAFTSPSFYALLELAVASRSDPALNARLAVLGARFERVIAEAAGELFPEVLVRDPAFATARRTLFFLLQGLALSRIVRREDDVAQAILGHYAATRFAALEAEARPTPVRRRGERKGTRRRQTR